MLPASLASWRHVLALFDSQVTAALAPMLDVLWRAIGPIASDASERGGEPAGYDGVATRGGYERLLSSEWLLADELPDEFLRRAVTREHLFLAVARERPRGRLAATALIDVGPDLFGTPRIGALAALLVLSHRARAARATFGWKPAQATGGTIAGVEPTGIRALLDTRAGFPCRGDSLRAVVEAAREEGEVWFISGSKSAVEAEDAGASVVAIDDVIEPNERALSFRVHARGRPDRTVRLALPDDPTCVRVLRDPFPGAPPRPVHHAARATFDVARPVISASGRQVLARVDDGSVFFLSLPRSKRQQIGHGRVLHLDPPPGEIVAAGCAHGNPHVVAQHDYTLTLASWGRKQDAVERRLGRCNEPLRPPPVDGRLFPLACMGDRVLFIGRGGRLLEFRPGNVVRVLADDCCGLVGHSGAITVAENASGTLVRTMFRPEDVATPPPPRLHLPAEHILLSPTLMGGVACAYEERSRTWIALTIGSGYSAFRAAKGQLPVFAPDNPTRGENVVRIDLPGDSEVVAVCDHLGKDPLMPSDHRGMVSLPALLLLEEGRRRLRVTSGGRGPELRVALPVEVEHVVLEPVTRVAVCISRTAELLLVSLEARAVIARLGSEADLSR